MYLQPDRLVDVGGHRLSLYCAGEGSPTVVFDSGLGDSASSWSVVQAEVAKVTRTCSYDRAGYGFSEAGPMPRTSSQIVAELRALLDRSGERGPYVVVGHSFGGMNVRLFANCYRSEVAGIVLVDSSHENQMATHPPAFRAFLENLIRDHLRASLEQGTFTLDGYTTACSEFEHFSTVSADELRQTNRGYGTVPLRILCGGESFRDVFGNRENLTPERREEYEQIERDALAMRQPWLAWSSNARLTVLPRSGHYIQEDEPQAVIDAILEEVDLYRVGDGSICR